jgi:hypothetical protein
MKKIILARIFLNTAMGILLLASVVLVPAYSYAQSTGSSSTLSIKLQNPLVGVNTLPDFIDHVLTGIVQLLTPVIVIMFLWTGFLFVKAQGAPEALTKAKSSLMYTIIGAALVLGAKGLSLVLQATFTNL